MATLSEQAIAAADAPKPKRRGRTKEATHCPHCGGILTEARNVAHHRQFFKEVALVFENWPQDHPEFTPASREQLRGWLLIQAGHRTMLDKMLDVEDCTDLATVAKFINSTLTGLAASGHYGVVREHAGRLCVMVAKSIAFESITEDEFRIVHERVKDVYEREGIDVEALLKRSRLETKENNNGN